MANLMFEQEAQDYNDWLNDESDETVQEALDALPKEIKDRILEFGGGVVAALDEIGTAIDAAIEACESAAGCVEEMSSYAYSAESDLSTVTSELGGL